MEHYKKRERVLWHEIGHFTAHYFNKLYFGKYGVTEVYLTKESEYYGETEYKGYTTPTPPPGYKVTDPIKHPASMVASLTYGCIFQSIFMRCEFEQCFNYEQEGIHGFHDYNSVTNVKKRFSLSKEEGKKLDELIQQQYIIIKESKQSEALLATPINDFIEEDRERIDIDVNKLEQRLSSFLAIHGDIYKKYVERLNTVFADHKDAGSYI